MAKPPQPPFFLKKIESPIQPEVTLTVRRAEPQDNESIASLVNSQTRRIFGPIDLPCLLEHCFLTLVVEDDTEEVVAAVCFDDHPNLKSIPSWEWDHWLYNLYKLRKMTSKNTFFIHLMVWAHNHIFTFLKPVLEFVFTYYHYLQYIFLITPPGSPPMAWLEGSVFLRLLPKGHIDFRKVQTLYLTLRQRFTPKFKIRRAVEEDNDDLVPLIDRYCPRMKELYGEFYIAEIISGEENRQIIVAEVTTNNTLEAVAVLCVNGEVNYDKLNANFELRPFYGLRKPNEGDQLSPLQFKELESDQASNVEEDSTKREKSTSSSSYEEEDEISNSQDEDEESEESEFEIVNMSSLHLVVAQDESVVEERVAKPNIYSAAMLSTDAYETYKFERIAVGRTSYYQIFYGRRPRAPVIESPAEQVHIPLPTYCGEGNAFTLEILASTPEHKPFVCGALIEACFECFSDRDYCVIALPSDEDPHPFSKYFVRVPPRPIYSFPHDLYVLHRNAMLSELNVRMAKEGDQNGIMDLMREISRASSVIETSMDSITNPDSIYTTFVMTSEEVIVGFLVLRSEPDYEYIHAQFELTTLIDEKCHRWDQHAYLEHVVLSPIFQRHERYFLKETHRLSDMSLFYYKVFPEESISEERQRPLSLVLTDLLPVLPREKGEFNFTDIDDMEPEDCAKRSDPPFALFISTPKILSLHRCEINTRLVVVGASDTALAFLETLLCSPSNKQYITFTNVTLVEAHGLFYMNDADPIRDMLFKIPIQNSVRRSNMICLRTFINIVKGVMTGINRKENRITVNDSTQLPYNLLFLLCGEQYQKPQMRERTGRTDSDKEMEFPGNVFIINTESDASAALSTLTRIIGKKTTYNIIVYGCTIHAYCCLSALLEFGIKGSNITFVEPYPNHQNSQAVQVFNDPDVDQAVYEAMTQEGITVHQFFYFSQWFCDSDNYVKSIKFESRNRLLDLECSALFFYTKQSVSARTFSSINHAGLVYDGRLVIRPDFRTNDPHIFAAGTLTKYARRYHANEMSHKYYDSYEVGEMLGLTTREVLKPKELVFDGDEQEEKDAERRKLMPVFVKPKVLHCTLPGKLKYLTVRRPGRPIPMDGAMSFTDYGEVLTTGSTKGNANYFRLHINKYHTVETITCLTKNDLDVVNIKSLWGKHEKILNNVCLRFEMEMITDFYAYFREPWACALLHDRFSSKINDDFIYMTKHRALDPETSLVKMICDMYNSNKWEKLNTEQKKQLEEMIKTLELDQALEERLLNFIFDNFSHLPVYAHPLTIQSLIRELKAHLND